MKSYKEFKEKSLENAEVKAAYDEIQPEYDIVQAKIDARKEQYMTQCELSEVNRIEWYKEDR